eukprot:TRINITY_DN10747_c0_g1_i1.p1 TRINITY_DN10747_c0_g1~~TRINITY_DN10747_c0_g1_i1.p1  ORF type:complete len:102 (+),score=11.45 TRINITY_DN10747_c0_g1_i1:78-383(+)
MFTSMSFFVEKILLDNIASQLSQVLMKIDVVLLSLLVLITALHKCERILFTIVFVLAATMAVSTWRYCTDPGTALSLQKVRPPATRKTASKTQLNQKLQML